MNKYTNNGILSNDGLALCKKYEDKGHVLGLGDLCGIEEESLHIIFIYQYGTVRMVKALVK